MTKLLKLPLLVAVLACALFAQAPSTTCLAPPPTPPVLTQQQMDAAIVAQIGTDPAAPLPSNPPLQQAIANYAASAETNAAALNQSLIAIYNVAWQNFLLNVPRQPALAPPQPPSAYQAVTASDGWTYVIRGANPVCGMPPLPQAQPAGMVVAIGAQISGTSYWAALPNNANVPQGYSTPAQAADGATGIFKWVAFPFGGWWLKVQ